MLRLVEIPDGILDRDDLAMWLVFPPEALGFGTIPKYTIKGMQIAPVFAGEVQQNSILTSNFSISSIFSQQVRCNDKLYDLIEPTPLFTPEPPPIPDYNVTGVLTPDATCNYFYEGEYGGKPCYLREDGSFYIWWWTFPEFWVLSAILGPAYEIGWTKYGDPVEGLYDPGIGTTGNALVSIGGH